jgi:hypothetical protein
MADNKYDRYQILKLGDGTLQPQPYIKISEAPSDKYEYWVDGLSRMDRLSLKYYGDPFFDFLIIMANPEYLNEFDIPDDTLIRIPFPLSRVKLEYERKLEFFMGTI